MRYVCMMLACLLMVGCQEEELVPDYGEGVGYLRLKLGRWMWSFLLLQRRKRANFPMNLFQQRRMISWLMSKWVRIPLKAFQEI